MRNIRSNPLKGYTKSDYQSILKTSINGVSKTTLMISNKDSSETLKYKVLVYVGKNPSEGIEYVSETVLSASSTDEVVISNTAYSTIEVKMKNDSERCEYEINYVKQR